MFQTNEWTELVALASGIWATHGIVFRNMVSLVGTLKTSSVIALTTNLDVFTLKPNTWYWDTLNHMPVVLQKAVAEVSKNRQLMGEVSCCDAWMAERIHV